METVNFTTTLGDTSSPSVASTKATGECAWTRVQFSAMNLNIELEHLRETLKLIKAPRAIKAMKIAIKQIEYALLYLDGVGEPDCPLD